MSVFAKSAETQRPQHNLLDFKTCFIAIELFLFLQAKLRTINYIKRKIASLICRLNKTYKQENETKQNTNRTTRPI